jgi:hypothetical protein
MDKRTCPNCGFELVGVPASDISYSTWLEFCLGLGLLPVFVGLIIINNALKRMHSTPTHLGCPNCPWNSFSYKWEPVSEREGVERFLPPEPASNKIWFYIVYGIIAAFILVCWALVIWIKIEERF